MPSQEIKDYQKQMEQEKKPVRVYDETQRLKNEQLKKEKEKGKSNG